MATKSNLISSINSFLTATVTILKHRNSMLELINEFFGATHSMYISPLTPNVISYDLKFTKIGNLVKVNGFIRNGFTYMIGSQDLLTIDNSLYFAKTGESTTTPVVSNESLSNGLVMIVGDKIHLLTNLGAGNSFQINATYKTND